jgi:hypothetical protein
LGGRDAELIWLLRVFTLRAAQIRAEKSANWSLKVEALFGAVGGSGGRTRVVSAQAFSQAPQGLSTELFERAHVRADCAGPTSYQFDVLARPEAGRR